MLVVLVPKLIVLSVFMSFILFSRVLLSWQDELRRRYLNSIEGYLLLSNFVAFSTNRYAQSYLNGYR